MLTKENSSPSSSTQTSTHSSPRMMEASQDVLDIPQDSLQLAATIQNVIKQLSAQLKNKDVADFKRANHYFCHLLVLETRYLEAVCWGVIKVQESHEIIYNKVLLEATQLCRSVLLRYHPDKNLELNLQEEIGALNTRFTEFKANLANVLQKQRRPSWINEQFDNEEEKEPYDDDLMQALRKTTQGADRELNQLWQEINEFYHKQMTELKEMDAIFTEQTKQQKKEKAAQDAEIAELKEEKVEQDNKIAELKNDKVQQDNKIVEQDNKIAKLEKQMEILLKMAREKPRYSGVDEEPAVDNDEKGSSSTNSYFFSS